VQGGADPFFVTEDAMALRQALQELGLKRVTGKLIISGNFFMNFSTNPVLSGKWLKQVLSPPQRQARKRHRTVAVESQELTIAGPVGVVWSCPPTYASLARHRPLALFKILKRMNVYSSNIMAEMFTAALGGLPQMVQLAALAANVPTQDLHLINGSGLGPENQ